MTQGQDDIRIFDCAFALLFFHLALQAQARPIMKATFVRLAAEGATAKQVADEAIIKWRELDNILSPIIGKRGMAALYKRALYLVRADYPWLASAHAGELSFGDFVSLQTALMKQTETVALTAGLALYESFYHLLFGLIGQSLTERLLQSFQDSSSSSYPQQDVQ